MNDKINWFGNNKAIMTDEIQESAISQITTMASHPVFVKEKIRIMPDYHAGKGSVIGFTSTYSDLIIPNVVGVDIGCGVVTYKLGKIDVNFAEFDRYVRRNIPLGMYHRNKNQMEIYIEDWLSLYNIYDIVKDPELAKQGLYNILYSITENASFSKEVIYKYDIKEPVYQLGTLGGGNHFIELEKDKEENVYVSIHSGSRNFGLKIACIFQALAKYLMETFKINIEKDLGYLPMDFGGRSYLAYMKYAQEFAELNRRLMLDLILKYFKLDFDGDDNFIESVHNYIDFDQKIIRKGAIKVMKDTRVVIPLNMRDGIIIGTGKDNKKLENWNFSAPHGAGRVMGRKEAKRKLSMSDFVESMQGVWSTSVNNKTLDESPQAYKNGSKIIELLDDILNIEMVIKPIYSLKSED